MKVYNSFLGGIVVEDNGKHYVLGEKSKLNSKEVTKTDMEDLLKKFRHVNVINRPALCFTFEHILGKSNSHGVKISCKEIKELKVLGLSFGKKDKFPWE